MNASELGERNNCKEYEVDDMHSEEDDDEDKKQFGIYQCLPVDDLEPDWSTDEPTSVEEYLRRVRYVITTCYFPSIGSLHLLILSYILLQIRSSTTSIGSQKQHRSSKFRPSTHTSANIYSIRYCDRVQ